ncbi:MAG: leucyl aminopeptidase [Gammaproteobacteria bacterium]|nr:MAG: leucyl aminopeptidase [Gammaproteobacteria bacterium]
MEYSVKSGSPEKQRTAALVVGIHERRKMTPAARALDAATGGAIAQVLRRGDMDGKPGTTLLLHQPSGIFAQRILLVGCGKERDFDEGRYRQAIETAARELDQRGAIDAVSYLTELRVKGRDIGWMVRQHVEVTEATRYRFDRMKSEVEPPAHPLKRLVLSVPSRADIGTGERAIEEGLAIAEGVTVARDLGNLPGNVCTPRYLAEQAQALAKKSRKVKVTVLDETQMEKEGMGALLAVARGTHEPARLIVMEYQGAGKEEKPIALVGKGVTFDSGGISIKPSQAMDEMKFDMCGAASVIGTFHAAIRLQLPINLLGVIPATENLPGGSAIKPGDIVKSLSGQTIEILNTDAEGRLILCDALTYAGRWEPEAIVDIATLTGACVIALGNHAAGLLTNTQALGNELLAAGRQAYDRAWELPLWDEYQKQLDSNFADMANVGGREAGTITAACFLSRFVKNRRWAHLDIAGVAWKQGKEKGATGRPVPLLVQFLLNRVEKKREA